MDRRSGTPNLAIFCDYENLAIGAQDAKYELDMRLVLARLLDKGNVIVIGRESRDSLYAADLVTFEDDQGAYDQKDAEGFIKLNALRLRTLEMRNRRGG